MKKGIAFLFDLNHRQRCCCSQKNKIAMKFINELNPFDLNRCKQKAKIKNSSHSICSVNIIALSVIYQEIKLAALSFWYMRQKEWQPFAGDRQINQFKDRNHFGTQQMFLHICFGGKCGFLCRLTSSMQPTNVQSKSKSHFQTANRWYFSGCNQTPQLWQR